MKRIFFFCFFLLSCAHASRTTVSDRVTAYLKPEIGVSRAGAIVGIFDKGVVSYLSFGGIREDQLLEVASLTKTFTALLYSIALEKGLITEKTSLGDLRPEWKHQKLGSIRLQELATHRAGLPRLPCDFFFKNESNPYVDYDEKLLINSITDQVISSHPGCQIGEHPSDEVLYSNWGMGLLGNALSLITNMSFEELLKEWITKPLNMHDTVITLSRDQRKRLAQGHDENLQPAGTWERSGMWGNGAIISTASDLMIYARAMLRPQETPFPKAILRSQKRQHANMGLGWFLTRSGNIWHDGMTGGYASMFKAYLREDLAVVALSNSAVYLSCFIAAVEDSPCNP